jgi:hypothetical protein
MSVLLEYAIGYLCGNLSLQLNDCLLRPSSQSCKEQLHVQPIKKQLIWRTIFSRYWSPNTGTMQ